MHHSINYHLAQACLADLRNHAQRVALVRAALACALGCCAGSAPFLAPAQAVEPAVAGDTPTH